MPSSSGRDIVLSLLLFVVLRWWLWCCRTALMVVALLFVLWISVGVVVYAAQSPGEAVGEVWKCDLARNPM